jgi:dihydroxycyclohexadiene carboxylate dehydrogenase
MADELDPRAAGARRLKDKVCVVTGAGQGIGRASARRLGQEGGKIVVADRIDESATKAVLELHDRGVEAVKALVDLTSFAGAQELMRVAKAAYGRIDVLVNNVGGTIWIKPYHLYSEDEVKLELERSLYPTLWCCLAALPIMMEQRSGAIVNIGSQAVRGLYRLPYAASKGGIEALTKVLSMEYGSYGIRVNTVSPAGTEIPDRVTPRLLIRPRWSPTAPTRKNTAEKWAKTFAVSKRCAGGDCRRSRRRPSPFLLLTMRATSPDRSSIAVAVSRRVGGQPIPLDSNTPKNVEHRRAGSPVPELRPSHPATAGCKFTAFEVQKAPRMIAPRNRKTAQIATTLIFKAMSMRGAPWPFTMNGV